MNLLHEITLWVCIVIVLGTLWLLSTPMGLIGSISFIVWYMARGKEYYSEPEVHTNQQIWEFINPGRNHQNPKIITSLLEVIRIQPEYVESWLGVWDAEFQFLRVRPKPTTANLTAPSPQD